MVKYFQTPTGSIVRVEGGSEATIDSSVDPTWTAATEEDHAAQAAATAAAVQARRDDAAAGNLTLAQSVYDEIVGIHPVSALALAQLIHPDFAP